MAFLDRSHIVRTADRAPLAPGKELMIGILLAALLATLAIRNLMPADALAPAIVTLMFAIGAAAAGAAWLCRARRFRVPRAVHDSHPALTELAHYPVWAERAFAHADKGTRSTREPGDFADDARVRSRRCGSRDSFMA